jgi:lipoprotein-anchoring transpeptidase ErfK/SrfK
MRRVRRHDVGVALTLGAFLLWGCAVKDVSDKPADTTKTPAANAQQTAQPQQPSLPAPAVSGSSMSNPPSTPAAVTSPTGNLAPDSVDIGQRAKADSHAVSRLRLEVDLSARKLYVYDGDARIATHSVAVGSAQWPTKTGEWNVTQVVWNPEWIPPDESWAEQRTPKKPGAPDNPLGRAQLVYDAPRTIHGTNEPASIGRAVSHGSIRLPNTVIVPLARQLMESSGAGKDDAWYARVQKNRTEKVAVDLPQRVPIRIF